MKIKAKCPNCGVVVSGDWKTSPILLKCPSGHRWHPRQDMLSAVYVHKSVTETSYLEV